jgi:hypothetical protein
MAYVKNDPVNLRDWTGTGAVWVHCNGYPIETRFGTLPLGHAGAAIVDESTGATEYFEFGRYGGDQNGRVRSRPVKRLELNEHGFPTRESLDEFEKDVERPDGVCKGQDATVQFNIGRSSEKAREFVKNFSKNHEPYHWFFNNCKTFASEVAFGE